VAFSNLSKKFGEGKIKEGTLKIMEERLPTKS